MSIRTDKVAKYAQVRQTLREKISRGDFGADGLLPSDRELMGQLKVSRQTVIRALHELRAEGVVRREHGKGTFLTKKSQQGEIGLLTYLNRTTPNHSAYLDNLLRSIVNRLCELGHEPRLYGTFGTEEIGNIHTHGQKVLEHCARGRLRCLLVSSSYNANEVETAVARWGVHVLGMHQELALSRYNVAGDFPAAVADGVRDLLRRGFRKIALITGKQMYASVSNRVEAYLKVVEEKGLSIRPGWIRADLDPSPKAGYEQFRRLWAMDDRPEAVLLCDDFMALGATRAMVEMGLNTPRDVTVMSLMNQGSGLVFPLPIIALEVDPEPVGEAGAEMAVRFMRGETIPEPHLRVKPTTRISEVTRFPDSTADERGSEKRGMEDLVPNAETTPAAGQSA